MTNALEECQRHTMARSVCLGGGKKLGNSGSRAPDKAIALGATSLVLGRSLVVTGTRRLPTDVVLQWHCSWGTGVRGDDKAVTLTSVVSEHASGSSLCRLHGALYSGAV